MVTLQDKYKADESLELFASTFYEASVGMFQVKMPEGRFLRANKYICQMLGYTEEEFCRKTILEVTHPDDVQLDLDQTSRVLNDDLKTFVLEKRLLKKDGTPLWTRLTATSVVKDNEGLPKFGMAVIEDISKVKLSEEHLLESERRFQVMADSVPVSIAVTDSEPKCIYINKGWLDYTGQTPKQALGQGWKSAVHPEDRPYFDQIYLGAIDNQLEFRLETRVLKRSGEYGWMLITGVPRYTETGLFLGYIASGVDISDRKLSEEALQYAKSQAEEANRNKSEFISMISHELKSPLHSIIGFTELSEMEASQGTYENRAHYASLITSNSYHLLGLVNDLLDIAKIEAGKLKIYPCAVQLQPLVKDVFGMMEHMAKAKSVRLETVLDPDLTTVEADPERLKQILLNLVNNAIKFNNEGGVVQLTVYRAQDQVAFEVKDSGIGIPQQNLESLFQKFYQVDSSNSRAYGGTGLGLALCQQLAEFHGGKIAVQSTMGEGAVFTLRIPHRQSSSK